ncbi:MAG: Ig-like domain-containing protein [Verrucomicrobiota bacterium]
MSAKTLPCVALSLLACCVCFLSSAHSAEIQRLDASIGSSVTGSNPVTQWDDQSGSGNHALQDIGTVTYPSGVTFASGLTGLDFDATRNGLQLFTSAESDSWLDQSSGNGFCVFVALRVTTAGGTITNDILGNSSGQGSGFFGLRILGGGGMRAYLGGTTVTQGGAPAVAGDSIVLSFRYDPVAGEFRFWDSKNTTANFGSVAAADFSNGTDVRLGTITNGSRFLDGLVGEVIVHDTSLSLVEVQQIETALAAKWTEPPPTPALQHLDASVPTSVAGNPVTQWDDQSGNSNHAVPHVGGVSFPGAMTFESGRTGLDFGSTRNSLELFSAAGSDAWLDQSSGNGFTVLVAFKSAANISNWNDIIGNSSAVGSGFGMRYSSNGSPQIYLGGVQINPGGEDIADGDTIVYSFRYDPGTSEMRFWESKNAGVTTDTVAPADFSTTNPVRLGTMTNGSRFLDGLVGEVLIYDRALDLVELGQLETDLVKEWITGGSGPGFPNVTQTEGAELGSFWADPIDRQVRTVVLDYIDGYVMADTRALASDGSSHSHQVWDISNPAAPVEVARSGAARGMHKSEVLLPNHRVNQTGNDYYNVSDMLNITGETPPGYVIGSRGGRSTYLLPYHYYSGLSDSRLEIADARVSTAAIATLNDHGFVGFPIPIGNLLIVAGILGQDTRAVATYDISDPTAPILLDLISGNDPVWTEDAPSYEAFVWKHYIVLPNVVGGGNGDDCAFVDFSDPSNLRWVLKTNGEGTFSTGLPGRTRYAQFQDDIMFLGGGKYDMTPLDSDLEPTLLDTYLDQAGEYMLPLGNLIVSAENSEQGNIPDAGGPYPAKIYAHQAAPDTDAPTVAYHSPAAGATNQNIKSRIGVIIHETLDYATINPMTFRVFPVAGGPDVTGTLNASDKDILTFTPHADLLPGTTYRVSLEAGGIADAAGNTIAGYTFDFTTAGGGGPPPILVTDVSSSPYPATAGVVTNLSVVASGGAPSLEYRWDFGDGTPVTAWSALDANISHTYAGNGHYSVLVQVRDGSATPQISSKSFVVTVASAPAGAAPTKASQIICDEANRRVYCVNPDNDTVTVINADTLAKVLEFSVGKDPRSVAQDSAGNLWITCLDDDTLEVRSRTTGVLIDTIVFHRGSRPHDVVFNNLKSFAYVTLKGSGRVVRIDGSTRQVDADLDAGPNPTAIAMASGNDEFLVTRFISPDTSGEVRSFDNADNGGIGFQQTITLAEDTTASDDGVTGRGLPNYLADVAIDPFGQFAWVTSKKDNIARGHFRDGLALTADTTVRAIVSKINLATNTEVFGDRIDIDDRSQPSALAFSPLGDYLFAALQGSNEVKVIDTFSGGIVATLSTGLAPQGLCVDASTSRLFIKNLTDRTVTVHDLTLGLEEGDFSTPALATIGTVAVEAMAADVLLGKQVFYNAADPRMGFAYISCAVCHQDGDDDGRTWDFTDRGEGLRNTTNLRGRAGMAHGNVHWSGNFDEIQDFEVDMVNAFGGTGFLAGAGGPNPPLGDANVNRSAELDALAAYVVSLGADSVEKSPHRNADDSLTLAGSVGKGLFEGTLVPASGNALSCVICHNPATGFTDSTVGNGAGGTVTLHDVGTIKASSGERLGGGAGSLTGIDTPTLMGLHAAGPYLHDGSAATIAAVFDQFDAGAALGQDGSAHDLSATGYELTAAEKNNLIAYLMEIDGTAEVAAPPEDVFRHHWALHAGGSEDFLDWSGNGVANILYFLFGLGDPNNPAVTSLVLGGSPAAGLPLLEDEGNGTYTYSYVRHQTQTDFDYVILTSSDLSVWEDVDEVTTSYRPTATTTTSLGGGYEIRHLHFNIRGMPSFFRVMAEPVP